MEIKDLINDLNDYLDCCKTDINSIINNNLDKDNMILDVNNFIFELNKEQDLLTSALKEFIEYYIKYKQ